MTCIMTGRTASRAGANGGSRTVERRLRKTPDWLIMDLPWLAIVTAPELDDPPQILSGFPIDRPCEPPRETQLDRPSSHPPSWPPSRGLRSLLVCEPTTRRRSSTFIATHGSVVAT
ncbi:hypothetical protein BHE90_005476 [Fusarium euwallaceae]|uniref:Uncharacterized protein n=1 Tax=Fusarium euwallaceae TaxID=1147111 RepID=A0A430LWD9_9HYPO|nr:hypothetical protein BHE90_005476 [Fusarium euwallaceae]